MIWEVGVGRAREDVWISHCWLDVFILYLSSVSAYPELDSPSSGLCLVLAGGHVEGVS